MPVVLRTGTAEDADACAKVWERSIVARDGELPADLAHVVRRLASGDGRLRIGADGASVLGFALMLRAGADALLTHLAVMPAAQRRGLAGRLVADAIEHAREHRAGRLLLEVRTGNHGALALYAGLGFTAGHAPVPHPLGGHATQLLSLDLR
jgi:ribosomal protein S18 acetylase RimI-like enzyme